MRETRVHFVRWAAIGLADVLDLVSPMLGVEPIAMTCSPPAFSFWRVESGGSLVAADGSVGRTGSIYDCRAFGEEAELRWLHRGSGLGHAVLVTERALDGTCDVGQPASTSTTEVIDVIEGRYLLWGRARAQRSDGWTTLAEPRVGRIDVPVRGVQPNCRAYLRSREYVCEGAYGNTWIADERLIGLEGDAR